MIWLRRNLPFDILNLSRRDILYIIDLCQCYCLGKQQELTTKPAKTDDKAVTIANKSRSTSIAGLINQEQQHVDSMGQLPDRNGNMEAGTYHIFLKITYIYIYMCSLMN